VQVDGRERENLARATRDHWCLCIRRADEDGPNRQSRRTVRSLKPPSSLLTLALKAAPRLLLRADLPSLAGTHTHTYTHTHSHTHTRTHARTHASTRPAPTQTAAPASLPRLWARAMGVSLLLMYRLFVLFVIGSFRIASFHNCQLAAAVGPRNGALQGACEQAPTNTCCPACLPTPQALLHELSQLIAAEDPRNGELLVRMVDQEYLQPDAGELASWAV